MTNKKGFTLIELTISITLVSVVMVFMLRFVTLIRNDEESISLNTEMYLSKSLISEQINKDILKSNGIKSLSCTTTKCTIDLNNDETKSIELTKNNTILKYINKGTDEIEFTRSLPENYQFSLSKIENDYLYIIRVEIVSHPEYNIEIVNKKS